MGLGVEIVRNVKPPDSIAGCDQHTKNRKRQKPFTKQRKNAEFKDPLRLSQKKPEQKPHNETGRHRVKQIVPDDIGIFSTDLTDEAIASMQNGEFDRCVVAITGNAFVCGDVIYDLSMRYAAGEKLDHEVYRDLIPVTPENLEEMITK